MSSFACFIDDPSNLRTSLQYAISAIMSHNEAPTVCLGKLISDSKYRYSRGPNLCLRGSLYYVRDKIWLQLNCADAFKSDSQYWFEQHMTGWNATDNEWFTEHGRLLSSGSFSQLLRESHALTLLNASIVWIPKPVRKSCLVY